MPDRDMDDRRPDPFQDTDANLSRLDAADNAEIWLRELYNTHWVSMVRLASLLLGGTERAEEIVQDGLVAIHARRDQFESLNHAGAYLRTIVVNRCRSAHRHLKVVQRYRPEPGGDVANPQDVSLQRETNDQVMTALRKLPQRQFEVLVLRYYSDASEAQIAETLGISQGAVKSHAHRGMQTLRNLLADVVKEGR